MKLHRSLPLLLCCLLAAPTGSQGAGFTVIFEHLIGAENGPLPILEAQTGRDPSAETWDGTWTMDSYGGFERYDENRLLLGIRENGINETADGHDAELAAQFPDRSLIWINADNGAPMGIALEVGFDPVPLDADFLGAGGSTLDYYMNFASADDGVIYLGYKNKILRYAPNEAGDGFDDPTVAHTMANDGTETWSAWRYEHFRAFGSGVDTVLIAGGKTWRPNQGYREFTTEDGLTFTAGDPVGFKGGSSRIIPAPDGATATEEVIYGTLYPGGSNGVDTKIVRNVRDSANETPFGGLPFDIGLDEEIGYLGQFVSDVDVHPSFPYLVSYSTPSWNSAVRGIDPPGPGWIAVHDQFYDPEAVDPETGDGKAELIGLRRLDVSEDMELLGETAPWYGTLGKVTLNVLPGMRPGQAELLWYSGIYGYGRYTLDFAPKEIVVSEIVRDADSNETRLTFASETGAFYDVERSMTLEPGSWTRVMASMPSAGDETTMVTLPEMDPSAFYRIGRGIIYR
ncbi:MAG: hypothetical protein AAF514_09195, partial [Verrucomicrobiota bacterium]